MHYKEEVKLQLTTGSQRESLTSIYIVITAVYTECLSFKLGLFMSNIF